MLPFEQRYQSWRTHLRTLFAFFPPIVSLKPMECPVTFSFGIAQLPTVDIRYGIIGRMFFLLKSNNQLRVRWSVAVRLNSKGVNFIAERVGDVGLCVEHCSSNQTPKRKKLFESEIRISLFRHLFVHFVVRSDVRVTYSSSLTFHFQPRGVEVHASKKIGFVFFSLNIS